MAKKLDLNNFGKIGFVASGGSAKALFYHIGVSFALKERGIEFAKTSERESGKHYIDLVVGSSGGSIFATFVANGFDEWEIEHKLENKKLWTYFYSPHRRRKGDLTGFSYADIFMPNLPMNGQEIGEIVNRYFAIFQELGEKSFLNFGLESFLKKIGSVPDGLCRLDGFEKYLEDVLLSNDFNELLATTGIELYVIATELNNPRKAIFGPLKSDWVGTDADDFYRDRYLNTSPISKAVTASCAVPGLFKPVKINNVRYIDGETKKALSTHVAADQNCDLIFVSHTFTPHLETADGDEEFGIAELAHQAFQTLIYQKIQTQKEIYQSHKKIFDYLASSAFRNRTHVTKEQQEEVLNIYEELAGFNRKRKYIFIPSPPETFHLDYFNIFPPMVNELINTGYATANVVLDFNGLPKLPEFEKEGILNNLGVARKRFRLLKKYQLEKEEMKAHYPKFL